MVKIKKGAKHLSVDEDKVKNYLLNGWRKLDEKGKEILSDEEKGMKALQAEIKELREKLSSSKTVDASADLKKSEAKVVKLEKQIANILKRLKAKDLKEFNENLTKLVQAAKGDE